MKKQNEQILNYEAPEVEVMDFRLEKDFLEGSNCQVYSACGGVDSEEVCLTDTPCLHDFEE